MASPGYRPGGKVGSGPVSRGRSASHRLAVLHELFAGLPVPAAYLAGPDLVFEFANDAYRQLVGREDLTGRTIVEALPDLAAQGRAELIAAVLESGKPFQGYEIELFVRRDAASVPEQIFVECLYQPVRGADGQVDGVLLLVSNVTAQVRERRQQEALATQLATTQERYQTLFETLPQGVIYYDVNGLILGANPAACQILGLDEDEMITWPVVTAGQAVHEDGSPLQPGEFPVTMALRTGEVVTDVVVGVKHGITGELRWLRITAVPDSRDEKGHPQRAYAMFRDLTSERRAAAALREGTELLGLLREANVIGVVVNGDDHVHDANDAFLGIIGYTREDVEAGRISREGITPPDWWEADADAHRQLTRTGAFWPYEKEYMHRDGHRVPVLVGAAVISTSPLRWVTYVVDLSARQRAEEERVLLLARERTARADAEGAKDRVSFLLQAGSLVAAAQDGHELLQHAAQLVVHSLADFCLVFLPGPQGDLRAISIAHREPGGGVDFTDLRGEPVPALGEWTVRTVFTSRATQVVHDAAAQMAPHLTGRAVLRDIVARVNPGDVVITPLMAGWGRSVCSPSAAAPTIPTSPAPTSRWSRNWPGRPLWGWPTRPPRPGTIPWPRRCSAPCCPTRCLRFPGWNSRSATSPGRPAWTSAATGTTRSRWKATGSGWSSATWSATTSAPRRSWGRCGTCSGRTQWTRPTRARCCGAPPGRRPGCCRTPWPRWSTRCSTRLPAS